MNPTAIPFKEQYVTRAGSHAYGLATETSDLDLRGLFFPESLDDALGFLGSSKHWTGIGDLTLWELRRFFDLAAKGNPNVIETLFTEDEDVVASTVLAGMVRRDRDLFLSKRIVSAAIGFALAERLRVERKWDPKGASHVLRLMWQTTDLIKTNTLRVRQPKAQAEVLVAIKMDRINDKEVNRVIAESLSILRKEEEKCKLPDSPDMDKLNKLCAELLHEHIHSGG